MTPAEIITHLDARERALGDPLDVPRTVRAYEAYWKERQAIAAVRSALLNLPADVIRTRRALDAALKQAEVLIGAAVTK